MTGSTSLKYFNSSGLFSRGYTQVPNSNKQLTTSRAEQKRLTRQKLLNAAIDIIAEDGFAGVTMAKVSTKAGLSRGLCSFHFETKEQLMLESIRLVYQQNELAWRKAIEQPELSPENRLRSLINVQLSPPVSDPRTLSVLVSLWGVAPHRKTYLELFTESDLAYEAAIETVLRELADGQETVNGMSLKAIAVMLTALIDGAHVQILVAPGRLNMEEGIQGCLSYLSSFFPCFSKI